MMLKSTAPDFSKFQVQRSGYENENMLWVSMFQFRMRCANVVVC